MTFTISWEVLSAIGWVVLGIVVGVVVLILFLAWWLRDFQVFRP